MTKILITGLVTIHLAATLWHGSAHTAFLFGAYHHYVLVSPDNIGHLPPSLAQGGGLSARNAKSNRPLRVVANNFCDMPFPQPTAS